MNWHSGSITDAVSLSKSKNSIFVVYVEGNDELSQKMRNIINEDKIRQKLESDKFVAVRIESGSEAYMQFAQIYQLVPLPSLFFIGKSGTPLEIATGIISSADELEAKINRVLTMAGFKIEDLNTHKIPSTGTSNQSSSAQASASFISGEKTASENSNVVCDGDVCYKITKPDSKEDEKPSLKPQIEKEIEEETKETSQPEIKPDSELMTDSTPEVSVEKRSTLQPVVKETNNDDSTVKLEQAKKLLEEKRKEKEAEEVRLEREKELRRRKEGQDVQNLKKWKEEHELKELQENIRRERLEEQAARQRILEKIANDKAERVQKFGQPVQLKAEEPSPKPVSSQRPLNQEALNYSRIQFRKPDGESEMHTFNSTDTFLVVRNYVRNTVLQGTGIREFSLATTFPRKEFITEYDNQTLRELELCPTAVLLIITKASTGPNSVVARSGGFINIFNTIFWGILSPFFAAFNYVRSFITGTRSNSTESTGDNKKSDGSPNSSEITRKRPLDRFTNNSVIDDFPSTSGESKSDGKSRPYRRVGNSNIHRLRDHKDSDDENNTWNGNSTQQQ